MKSLPRSLEDPPPLRAPEQRVPTAAITASFPSTRPPATDGRSPAPCRGRGAARRGEHSPSAGEQLMTNPQAGDREKPEGWMERRSAPEAASPSNPGREETQ